MVTNSKITLRSAEKALFDNKDTKLKDMPKELKEAAEILHAAREYVNNITSSRPVCVEAFRVGFIGKTISDESGTKYVQTSRGKPIGYIAAVEKDGEIYYGWTFASEAETFVHPIIGQANAIKHAIEASESKASTSPFMRTGCVAQYEHFIERSKRFFFAEKYSYSRGSEPIKEAKDFAEIHAWQDAVKCMNAKSPEDFKNNLKKFEEMCIKMNPKLK